MHVCNAWRKGGTRDAGGRGCGGVVEMSWVWTWLVGGPGVKSDAFVAIHGAVLCVEERRLFPFFSSQPWHIP